ncbi:MAG: SUMF1/EgtB/PvdO family nonheme iron enzyme [Anaerolineaceae bacterium]|nr:SUMF1/EgtB/PvdO family nonheme iron enzyme [Anaerolineaceae bacterium]
MSADHSVFISYARKDGADYAAWLHDELETRGFSVWRDVRNVRAGNFIKEIERAILNASFVIVIRSWDTEREGTLVEPESLFAFQNRKRCIPIHIDEVRPYFFLNLFTRIEAFRLDREEVLTQLLQLLEEESAPSGDDIWTRKYQYEPEVVRIPAGSFLMGSKADDPKAYKREKPQHTLTLNEFGIGKYPITNHEYGVFVRASGHHKPSHWVNGRIPRGESGHPVVNVSWQDAMAYCQWLSERTEKRYLLPSEAEWEKAARGTQGRVYPWGNELWVGAANSKEAHIDGTTAVGQYSPKGDSLFGCADMAGNVWEWTRSMYFNYPYEMDDGRESLLIGGNRVLRGGSWDSTLWGARCAVRRHGKPNEVDDRVGFRVVLYRK